MAAGVFVFPAIMGVFILFVAGYVIATPATPAPDDPQSRLIRVQPGDSLTIEVTAYYDDGFVFFSTQEEKFASLKRGDLQPQLQDRPVGHTLSGTQPGLDRALVGHRVNDSFTTPVISAKDGYGDWESKKDLPRVLVELPLRVVFTGQTQIGPDRFFNASEYIGYWEDQGETVEPGAEWACEQEELWTCRIAWADRANNSVAFDRLIQDGQSFPIAALGLPLQGDDTWNFTTTLAGSNNFGVRLDPPVGSRFQLVQSVRQPYDWGSYQVLSLSDQTIATDYTDKFIDANGNGRYDPNGRDSLPDLDLIGRTVYYDIEILLILRE